MRVVENVKVEEAEEFSKVMVPGGSEHCEKPSVR